MQQSYTLILDLSNVCLCVFMPAPTIVAAQSRSQRGQFRRSPTDKRGDSDPPPRRQRPYAAW